jgi:hypothetical protein
VDRAALDAARELGIEHGGFCPRGRLAEDGPIPAVYHMTEMTGGSYPARTAANVKAADGVLVLIAAREDVLSGGTSLTMELARRYGIPTAVAILDPDVEVPKAVRRLVLGLGNFGTLMVAGPRESKRPGIYAAARAYLLKLFAKPPEVPRETE